MLGCYFCCLAAVSYIGLRLKYKSGTRELLARPAYRWRHYLHRAASACEVPGYWLQGVLPNAILHHINASSSTIINVIRADSTAFMSIKIKISRHGFGMVTPMQCESLVHFVPSGITSTYLNFLQKWSSGTFDIDVGRSTP